MFIFTLLVIGLLCLAFKPTRMTGVAGLTLLALMQPTLFAVSLVVAGIAFLIHKFIQKRRKLHGLSKLPAGRD